eukprot:evm.model.scf_425EXC.9 EVM.evm.TU.scf_425EXC.9   scf_425EXC:49753-52578(+)
MSCGGPRYGTPAVDCAPGGDGFGTGSAGVASGGTAPGGSASEIAGQAEGEADGIKLMVLSACVLAFLLFLYVVLQYIRQQRLREREQQPQQDLEGQRLVELAPKKVIMYEGAAEDSSSVCSDCPVVVVNDGSFSGLDRGAVAVGWPEHSGQSDRKAGQGSRSDGDGSASVAPTS